MAERDRPDFFDERFATLAAAQEGMARLGYLYAPVPREHAEGQITGPLLHRVHTQIKKRGFDNVAGRVAITFSGYARDRREIFEVPEVRAYWQKLDAELPELPALLAFLPQLQFNGPGQQLLLLGEVGTVIQQPAEGGYDVHIVDAPRLVEDARQRIQQAGRKYHLDPATVGSLTDRFVSAAGHHR